MRYRLLGPLRAKSGDGAAERAVDLGPPKQRAVLAALLLAGGRVVSVDRLIDAVWGEDVPGAALASLQAYVSNLRRALRDGAPASQMASPIVRQSPGYYLDVGPDDVDLTVFTAACARARAAVDASEWKQALEESDAAMSLWHGEFLEDLADEPWVGTAAAAADQRRRDCLDDHITALLALGRVPAALSAAADLNAADPLADRGCWLLALTLYRAGRAADALDACRTHARRLDDELGVRPGPALRQLQTAILQQAPELAAWPREPGWTGATDMPAPSGHAAPVTPEVPMPARFTLVGRDRETTTIAEVLADVAGGATRWLVLSGPPGIGKTRLAEEAAARVTDGGGGVAWVSCPDEQATPPWWPMRQLVRALGADADEVLSVPQHVDPDIARFQVYERIQWLIESATDVCTVIVDDVQWADSASLSALAYVAGALREHPVAIVLTVRDGEHSPELRRLLGSAARGARNRHVEVPALSSADVAVLASQIADDEVSPTEAATLAVRTGGNPFFVCEYARLPPDERAGNDIPIAVKSVLDRRLANLDPAVLQVLRTAAVIGDEVDVPVLARATRLDLDTLADYLDEAADHRIVVTSYSSSAYVFAHGLLREQLVASMPALRRQRLHATVADVLVDGSGDDAVTRRAQHLVAAQPLVEPDVVVEACRRAAQEATQRWSSDIAATWWQAALDAYDRLPASARDEGERDALTVSMLEAHARAGRGRLVLDTVERYLVEAVRAGRTATAGRVASALLRASGGWPWLAPGDDPGQLLAHLEEAAALSEGDAAAAARILAALAVGYCYHPDPAVAAGHLDRAEALAESTGEADVVADVLVARLITYSGVATQSHQTLEWSDRLTNLQHNRFREDSLIAHSVSTMAAMNLGDVRGAEARLRAGIEGTEELQLPVLRAQLRWMEAVFATWHGDFAEAERHHAVAAHVHEQTELYEAGSALLAGVSLLREKGGPVPPEWPTATVGSQASGRGIVGLVRTALLTLDDGPGARVAATSLLGEWLIDVGRPHVWTTLGHTVLLAHLAADHGLVRFCAPLLAQLEPFGDQIAVIGQVGVAGPVALATARLHALAGDRPRARADLDRAVDIARRSGAAPTLVRCNLLGATMIDSELERRAAADAVAAEARRLGMAGVEAAALALS